MQNFKSIPIACLLAAAGVLGTVQAAPLSDDGTTALELNGEAMGAVFSSDQTYGRTEDNVAWQEWYGKLGISGTRKLGGEASLYFGASLLASATTGDGDAAGLTDGEESKIDLEDLYLGWKSSGDRLDISAGRQQFTLGDGFIIANDAVSVGNPLKDAGQIDSHRGGAYWLAPRKSFGNTLIARFNAEPWKFEGFWLASANDFQGKTELAGINLEFSACPGCGLGASWVTVTDVDDQALGGQWAHRDGMDLLNLRFNYGFGTDYLELAFGYVKESGGEVAAGEVDADAWYLQGSYTLKDMRWLPRFTYRFSTFSGDDPTTPDLEAFDPLFYGWTTGYGTWFQGEIAGNYAGPFNSNADIQFLNLTLRPRDNLSIGISYFDFQQREPDVGYGRELNVYAEWAIAENLIFSPLFGSFMPDDVGEGAQGNDDNSVYFQAFLLYLY